MNGITDSGRKDLWKIFQNAPKPQLHLHLDGSLSYEFIMRSAKRLQGRQKDVVVFEKNWEPSNEEELFKWLSNVTNGSVGEHFLAEECGNWKAFDICNQFLQTKEDLIDATFDLIKRISNEHNVNYLEVRFAPVLHTREGLSEIEVVSAVAEGFEKGTDFLKNLGEEFHGGLILCALRSFPAIEAVNVVKLISKMKNNNVLAFDIAGDEGNYPLRNFEEALLLAKELNISMTIHAGEWSEKVNHTILENIKVAVETGAKRLGHGVALRSLDISDEIFSKMQAKGISVEVNLTSNCTDPQNVASFKEHPLPKFLENEVRIAGLNVDNWLLAGNLDIGRAEPTGEYVRAFMDCGLTSEQLALITKTGYTAGFKEVPIKFIEDSMEVWKNDIIPKLEVWKIANGSKKE